MSTVELPSVTIWYGERGQGDPCVLLHPGGAGVDEVRLEHAIEMYRSLPNAEMAIVPGTSHGLLVEKPALCNQIITEFLTRDAVETFAPIRRAHGATS